MVILKVFRKLLTKSLEKQLCDSYLSLISDIK